MSAFDWAMAHTLKWEGGYSNHAADPGGRTMLGITQAVLDECRRDFQELNLPEHVEVLTAPQATAIYQRKYWSACHCEELPPAIALVVFDAAVNAGVGRARKWLQQSLRVKADGWIGQNTIAASKTADLCKAISEFHSLRLYHYMLLDTLDDTFALGWSRRTIDTHNVAMGFV